MDNANQFENTNLEEQQIEYDSKTGNKKFRRKNFIDNANQFENTNFDEQNIETKQESDSTFEPDEEAPKWQKVLAIIIVAASVLVLLGGVCISIIYRPMDHTEAVKKQQNYNPCDKNGHVYEWIQEIKPTCNKIGSINFYCIACDQILVMEKLPKLEHNYKNNVCTLCGVHIHNYQNNICTICKDKEYMFYIYDKKMWSSGNYYYFSGYVRNDDSRYHDYIKIKVKLYDKNENVFDSDWTYAVGSESLGPGESKYFEMMVRKTSKDCEYYSFSIIDYD